MILTERALINGDWTRTFSLHSALLLLTRITQSGICDLDFDLDTVKLLMGLFVSLHIEAALVPLKRHTFTGHGSDR